MPVGLCVRAEILARVAEEASKQHLYLTVHSSYIVTDGSRKVSKAIQDSLAKITCSQKKEHVQKPT